jgi:hypothetical protein
MWAQWPFDDNFPDNDNVHDNDNVFSLRWTGLQCGDAHSKGCGHSGLL